MGNNTSAFAGYLTPVGDAPLEGEALYDFVQEVIVGITDMEGAMVRPRYVSEPANIPQAGAAWCAFGIMDREADMFPQTEHVANDDVPEGVDKLQRHETLKVLASFYDLGVDGTADLYASLLRDGLVIAQNREAMMANGFDFAYSGGLQPVPVLLKLRWQYRVDLEFTLRRQIDRTYQVLNLKSAKATLVADTTASTARRWDEAGLTWDTPNETWDERDFLTQVILVTNDEPSEEKTWDEPGEVWDAPGETWDEMSS